MGDVCEVEVGVFVRVFQFQQAFFVPSSRLFASPPRSLFFGSGGTAQVRFRGSGS